MKLLSLAGNQLRNFVTSNVTVFCVYMVGIFFSVLIVIYAYGNTVPAKFLETITWPSLRTVEVVFPESVPFQEQDLAVMDEYGIQDTYVQHVTDVYLPFYDSFLILKTFRENNRGGDIVFCPLFDEAGLQGDKVIVSSEHKGDTVTLDGQLYSIERKVNFLGGDVAFLPLKAFKEKGISVDAIGYVFEDFSFLDKPSVIQAALQKEFPGGSIVFPKSRLKGLSPQDVNAILSIMVIFAICVIFFLILLQYIIRERSPELVVYGLVGAGRRHVFLLLMLQNLFIFLVAFLAALFVHQVFYPFIDQRLNFGGGIMYHAQDYLLLFGMVMGVAAVAQCPFIWRYTSKTLTEMKARVCR